MFLAAGLLEYSGSPSSHAFRLPRLLTRHATEMLLPMSGRPSARTRFLDIDRSMLAFSGRGGSLPMHRLRMRRRLGGVRKY